MTYRNNVKRIASSMNRAWRKGQIEVEVKNKATVTQRRGRHEQRAGDPTNEDKGDRKVDVTQPGGRSVTVLKTRRKRKVDKADTMRNDIFWHATKERPKRYCRCNARWLSEEDVDNNRKFWRTGTEMIKENHRDIENESSGRRGLSQDDVGNEMMLWGERKQCFEGPTKGSKSWERGNCHTRTQQKTLWMIRDKWNWGKAKKIGSVLEANWNQWSLKRQR